MKESNVNTHEGEIVPGCEHVQNGAKVFHTYVCPWDPDDKVGICEHCWRMFGGEDSDLGSPRTIFTVNNLH